MFIIKFHDSNYKNKVPSLFISLCKNLRPIFMLCFHMETLAWERLILFPEYCFQEGLLNFINWARDSNVVVLYYISYIHIYIYIYIYIYILLLLLTGFGGHANVFFISTQNIILISKGFFHSRVLKTYTYTIQRTVMKAV